MKKYFVHNGQIQQGPFDLQELKAQYITRDTMIWFEGLEDWKKAGEIPELEAVLMTEPPPFQGTVSAPSSKRNMWFAWTILGLTVMAGFYFYKQQQAVNKTSEQQQTVEQQRVQQEYEQKRAGIEQAKVRLRNRWQEYVKVVPSDFKSGLFGGIKGLSVEVQNNLYFPVEQVKVEVNHIRTNGKTYQTDTVVIANIPANGKKSVEAPDSKRGIKITHRVILVSSKRLNLCYTPEKRGSDSGDPYRCN